MKLNHAPSGKYKLDPSQAGERSLLSGAFQSLVPSCKKHLPFRKQSMSELSAVQKAIKVPKSAIGFQLVALSQPHMGEGEILESSPFPPQQPFLLAALGLL